MIDGEIFSQNIDLSALVDPFDKSSIYKIKIETGKQLFENHISCIASVWFQKQNTSGQHKIKANTFPELVKQLDVFIKSLKE